MKHALWIFLLLLVGVTTGCQVKPGTPVKSHGDEIVAAGQRFRIGTPVVLWTDPGGYDAYRVDKRFVPFAERGFREWADPQQNPQRYNLRAAALPPDQLEQVRGGGWTLEQLQQTVDQFVIHYDAAGTARRCFDILHDHRHLSVHFLLDIDGTIYQTLDLKERAWHAGTANDRSVGIEIANIGAYGENETKPWDRWYATDPDGRVRIHLANETDRRSIRTPNFVGRPARPGLVVGEIQGRSLEQYDLTPEQYDALIRLTAGLHRVLPNIALNVPRDAEGGVINHVLSPDRLAAHRGLVGHYHVSERKVDPGPAFDWDRVLDGAKNLTR